MMQMTIKFFVDLGRLLSILLLPVKGSRRDNLTAGHCRICLGFFAAPLRDGRHFPFQRAASLGIASPPSGFDCAAVRQDIYTGIIIL